MRIWIFNHYASTPDQQMTGPFDLARALVKKGYGVTIFASSFSHYKFVELRLKKGETWKTGQVEGVRFVWLRTYPYSRNDWRRVVNMLSFGWRAFWVSSRIEEGPDVVIGVTNHHLAALSAYLVSRRKRKPFFFELRDLWPLNLIQINALSPRNPVAWVLSILEKFLLKKAKRVISVLPFAGEYVASRGIPSEKVVWIPSALDFSRYRDLKPYHGDPHQPFTVMYIGGHVTMNAVDVILRAAEIHQRISGPAVRFVFVGGGQEKPNLVKLARTLKLENVEFRDPVPKSKLVSVFEEADVFVQSQRDLPLYKYGNNVNKLYEYMAAGRPVIYATNARYNPVKAADAGLTVPPLDAEEMARAIGKIRQMTPEERLRLGRNGRKYAEEQFDARLLATRLEGILMESAPLRPDLAPRVGFARN